MARKKTATKRQPTLTERVSDLKDLVTHNADVTTENADAMNSNTEDFEQEMAAVNVEINRFSEDTAIKGPGTLAERVCRVERELSQQQQVRRNMRRNLNQDIVVLKDGLTALEETRVAQHETNSSAGELFVEASSLFVSFDERLTVLEEAPVMKPALATSLLAQVKNLRKELKTEKKKVDRVLSKVATLEYLHPEGTNPVSPGLRHCDSPPKIGNQNPPLPIPWHKIVAIITIVSALALAFLGGTSVVNCLPETSSVPTSWGVVK